MCTPRRRSVRHRPGSVDERIPQGRRGRRGPSTPAFICPVSRTPSPVMRSSMSRRPPGASRASCPVSCFSLLPQHHEATFPRHSATNVIVLMPLAALARRVVISRDPRATMWVQARSMASNAGAAGGRTSPLWLRLHRRTEVSERGGVASGTGRPRVMHVSS